MPNETKRATTLDLLRAIRDAEIYTDDWRTLSVLYQLALIAKMNDNYSCYPGRKTLARNSSQCVDRLVKSLKILTRDGLIRKRGRKYETNLYYLNAGRIMELGWHGREVRKEIDIEDRTEDQDQFTEEGVLETLRSDLLEINTACECAEKMHMLSMAIRACLQEMGGGKPFLLFLRALNLQHPEVTEEFSNAEDPGFQPPTQHSPLAARLRPPCDGRNRHRCLSRTKKSMCVGPRQIRNGS